MSLLLATASLHAWAGDAALGRIHARGAIIVGYRSDAVPFSYIDESGQPIGYTIDVCQNLIPAIASAAGLKETKVVYQPVSAMTRFSEIERGDVDIECGATTNTRLREEKFLFSNSIFVTGTRLLTRRDGPVRRANDLMGRSAAVISGSTNALALARRVRADRLDLRVVEVADRAAAIAMLQEGAVDAIASDEVLLAGARMELADPGQWAIVGDYLSFEPYAIMMKADAHDLKVIVDAQITGMMKRGDFDVLFRKWFETPIEPRHRPLSLRMSILQRELIAHPNDRGAD